MNNNTQVVSVPRELLEHLHQHEDCPVEFIDVLRRILEQNVRNKPNLDVKKPEIIMPKFSPDLRHTDEFRRGWAAFGDEIERLNCDKSLGQLRGIGNEYVL